MIAATAEIDRPGIRAGTHALGLLAVPLNSLIVRTLSKGPRQRAQIRREIGSPAQSTLRSHLQGLEATGVIAKRAQDNFPGALEFELLEAGHDLQPVATVLERWLTGAPEGALELGSEPARAATRALVEGWSTTMLRTLAMKPLALTELARLIPAVSYPSLERRLDTMRMVGQLKTLPSDGRGTPHAVTAWLRGGVAPLTASARWERTHSPGQAAPIDELDVEGAFMLVAPTLQLPESLSGSCDLEIELEKNGESAPAGVRLEVKRGNVVSCLAELRSRGAPAARIRGCLPAWLAAVITADFADLEVSGDDRLAEAALAGLHDFLFGPEAMGTSEFSSKT